MRCRTLSGGRQAPAQGTDWTLTLDDAAYVRLYALDATLTPSATVASRYPEIHLQDPAGNVVYRVAPAEPVTTGIPVTLEISPVFGVPTTMIREVGYTVGLGWPQLWVPPGWRVAADTNGLLGGDQWSALSWIAEYADAEWVNASRRLALGEEIASIARMVA